MPHHIRDLVNLRYLWIQGNKLKEISTQICRLRNLKVSQSLFIRFTELDFQYLHAQNNNIEEISLAIGRGHKFKMMDSVAMDSDARHLGRL